MASATAAKATPIWVYRQMPAGAQPPVRRFAEKSGQNTPSSTYLYQGTPVQIDVAGATGYVICCPAMTDAATAKILGFSLEAGHNLSSSGVAGAGATVNQGAPIGQSSAVIIPGGAWPTDGTIGVALATDDVEFVGTLGHGSDNTLAIPAITMLGPAVFYGLTQDATNKFWYVDMNKATAGGGACVKITGFVDALGTLNGKVTFKVLRAAQQYQYVAS